MAKTTSKEQTPEQARADQLAVLSVKKKQARQDQLAAEALLDNLLNGVGGSWDWDEQRFGPRPASRSLAIRAARRAGEDAVRAMEDTGDEYNGLLKEQRKEEQAERKRVAEAAAK